MTYVPESFDRPQAWVDACSASLSIPKDEAAAMFSRMCGFNSWDIMSIAIGSVRPDLVDEKVSSSELVNRRRNYISVLVEEFGLHPSYAGHIVEQLSPSSGKKPAKISIDSSRMHGENSDNSIDLNPFGLDDDDIVNHLRSFLPEELGKELEGYTNQQVRDGMRLHHPIDPGLYYDFFENLGFSLVEESFNEEFELGSPSFFFDSEIEEVSFEVPCYLCKILVAPLDSADTLAESILESVKEDIESNGYCYALALWKSPTYKEYNGGKLFYIGRFYSDGVWKEVLLKSSDRSIDDVIENIDIGYDVNDPGNDFKWDDPVPTLIYHGLETQSPSSKHLMENFEIHSVRGISGWTSTLCGKR
ncbi:hypothetical protein ACYPKM_04530 [Pseudomonas aeruginosa]